MSLKACSICKEEKFPVEFSKKSSTKDGLQNHCKACAKQQFKQYYESNLVKHKAVITKRKKEVAKANAQYVWNFLKQNPCIDCGEKDPITLDFDHVRGKKKRAISQMVHRGASLNTVIDEMKKCEVRCANCHRKKTAKDFGWYKHINKGLDEIK